MTLTLGTAVRNALAAVLAVAPDAGSGPGVVRVYAGARPANPGTAPSGTLLAEFALNDPSFTGPSPTGVYTMDSTPVPATEGVAAGTATWARVLDSADTGVFDGKVSESGGGGDFIMSTTTVSVGLDLQLLSGTLTQPLGTAD